MVTSQNGWGAAYKVGNTVHNTPPLTKLSWITGSVRSGDVWTVFNELGKRFNAEVEPINPAHSWGFAARPIRGSAETSNHSSATAVDFNAPAHPLGKVNTFTPAQRAAIRRILNDLGGVVRWGGDYTGRKDDMHFEINASSAAVAKVADAIRNNTGITPPKPAEPKKRKKVDSVPVIYRAGGYGQYGVLAHNGGFVILRTKEETDNLTKAGVKVIWVEKSTLDNLIADVRA